MTITVKTISRKLVGLALAAVALILVLGIIAPFIDAAAYRQSLTSELETALGRHVDFDKISFSLFTGPGFSLEKVTIAEDPRYGLEPFAYVETLQARVRLDKLLQGKLQLSSLRLVQPSLNLVKRGDGTWNVVDLVNRLSSPRALPLTFFPAVEVSEARIDFKFGTRKTTLYILETDVSIYPERSGKLYIQFSGSPARTDRAAGNGFGHLRGTANWYLNPPGPDANQLEADVTLDPSNLSELTTLFEGYDIGVHGTVSSEARIEGPANALRVSGQFRLEDVHRWDLLPSRGENWQIRYRGNVDAVHQNFNIETVPWRPAEPTPVTLQVRAADFLTQPAWSILARLNKAPAGNLLPLGKRMGLSAPGGLALAGTLDGVIGYSNRTGLAGGVAIHDAVASLPDLPPLRAALATTSISSDRIHFDPATFQTSFAGTLKAGGDYVLSTRSVLTSLTAENVPAGPLKEIASAWFGRPDALAAFQEGEISGQLTYRHKGDDPPTWAGQLRVGKAVLRPDGLAVPLEKFAGHIVFDEVSLDVPRFTANVGSQVIRGEYHYDRRAKHTERIRFELPSADLEALEQALDPTLRAQGLWARFRFGRRVVPSWLAARNLEGEITVDELTMHGTSLGSLRSHVLWEGPSVQFSGIQLNLTAGTVRGHGSLNVAGYSPRYRLTATAAGFPWKGGVLNADGKVETSGVGSDLVQNLRAHGAFNGHDVSLSTDDAFRSVAGDFDFSLDAGWPNLRLSKIQAYDGDDLWDGQAASQSDGKLVLDLQSGSYQRRITSSLAPAVNTTPADLSSRRTP